MKLFLIIVLMGLAGLAWAWIWPKKPGWKRTPARTWPAGRGKTGLKPKLAPR